MRFEISFHGPLSGRTLLPGDRNLTLSVMALGILSPEPVTISNPSPSPDVSGFRNFLEHSGVEFLDSQDGFCLRGNGWGKDIVIDDEVPDDVIHSVISGAVFSGRSVRILNVSKEKISIIRFLQSVLGSSGLTEEHITEDGKDIIISGTEFVPEASITFSSARAFEAVSAAAMASHKTEILSFFPQAVSHSVRLLLLLGYKSSHPGDERSRDAELARRMAKAAGKTTSEKCRFEYTGRPDEIIVIPGDTTLAAAVSGAALVSQRSDIVLENVLWEQGRRGFFDALRRMKGNIVSERARREHSFDSADIRIRGSILEGIHLTSSQSQTMIPELMILGAVAAYAVGETVISDVVNGSGVGRDTFTAFARGLEMLGTHVGKYADGIVLKGGQELRGDLVESGGRADLALALVVAGLNAAGKTTVFGFDSDTYPVNEFMKIVKELSSG